MGLAFTRLGWMLVHISILSECDIRALCVKSGTSEADRTIMRVMRGCAVMMRRREVIVRDRFSHGCLS